MAKRRKSSGRAPEMQRAVAATTPKRTPPRAQKKSPAPSSGINRTWLWIGGAVVAIVVLAVVAYFLGWIPGLRSGTGSTPGTAIATRGPGPFNPPTATPMANPPAEPAGDGTTVTIETKLGNMVMEIYNQSAPVAAQNFTNLASAGYYNTLVFHRIMPGFVIQGGDPNGNGSGGPGYTIPDEPVVGQYARGTVAMARTSQPNSQGSQFFIVLDDAAATSLDGGGYDIFGKVTSGMEVADQIAAGASTGGQESTALNPVAMDRVTVQQPSASY